LKTERPTSNLSLAPQTSSPIARRLRITAVAVVASLACSGTTSCTEKQVVLSSVGIAAGLVLTTVGITLAIKDARDHTVSGCVYSDAGEFKLRTSNSKIYTLEGDPATLKVGDHVKFHGTKAKKTKGSDTAHQIFVVEKVSKDYGPCRTDLATAAAPVH
jgi:hypothetical protein